MDKPIKTSASGSNQRSQGEVAMPVVQCRENAEYVIEDADEMQESANRTCHDHLPRFVKDMFSDGSTELKICKLNEGSGFRCEYEENEMRTPEERLAAWAETQPNDNFVYRMSCGHELDSPVELTIGDRADCSMHVLVTITGE